MRRGCCAIWAGITKRRFVFFVVVFFCSRICCVSGYDPAQDAPIDECAARFCVGCGFVRSVTLFQCHEFAGEQRRVLSSPFWSRFADGEWKAICDRNTKVGRVGQKKKFSKLLLFAEIPSCRMQICLWFRLCWSVSLTTSTGSSKTISKLWEYVWFAIFWVGRAEIKQACALVFTNKLMTVDHTAFAPRPVALRANGLISVVTFFVFSRCIQEKNRARSLWNAPRFSKLCIVLPSVLKRLCLKKELGLQPLCWWSRQRVCLVVWCWWAKPMMRDWSKVESVCGFVCLVCNNACCKLWFILHGRSNLSVIWCWELWSALIASRTFVCCKPWFQSSGTSKLLPKVSETPLCAPIIQHNVRSSSFWWRLAHSVQPWSGKSFGRQCMHQVFRSEKLEFVHAAFAQWVAAQWPFWKAVLQGKQNKTEDFFFKLIFLIFRSNLQENVPVFPPAFASLETSCFDLLKKEWQACSIFWIVCRIAFRIREKNLLFDWFLVIFFGSSLAASVGEEQFEALPVANDVGKVVQDWLNLIRKPSFVLPDTKVCFDFVGFRFVICFTARAF